MMLKKLFALSSLGVLLIILLAGNERIFAQNKDDKKVSESKSIGGKEHDANIYGVMIGMDVPTALQAVFINANRQPGQEKPDAKRNEGKDKKDIRVVYKNLPQGEFQILFADGKFVKEMILVYAKPPVIDDLRLPFTSSLGNSTSLITTSTGGRSGETERGELSTNTTVLDGNREIDGFNATNLANTDRRRGEALDGARFDDRYTIAFTDNQKLQRLWFRDEKLEGGFKFRLQFLSEKNTKAGANQVVKITQKVIFLLPESENEFRKKMNLLN